MCSTKNMGFPRVKEVSTLPVFPGERAACVLTPWASLNTWAKSGQKRNYKKNGEA